LVGSSFLVMGRKSETEPTVSVFGEIDQPPTVEVDVFADSGPGFSQIYRLGRATGWVGQP